jgi:predicted transcriptional regulator of viral defense system
MEFDAETHTYYVNGEVVPSVTQVLHAAGIIDTQWFTEFGRWRGSAVHKATHYFDEGDMDRRTLDPIVKPFVADWKEFREKTKFTPTMIEKPYYDATYGYCGTPD